MNLQELSQVNNFLVAAHNAVNFAPDQQSIFQKEWDFLVNSEDKLIAIIKGQEQPADMPGDAEYGLFLYWLNDQKIDIFYGLLKKLGMPDSRIAGLGQVWETFYETITEGPGIVMNDGTLISNIKYATADLSWAWAYLCYLRSRYGKHIPGLGIPLHPFGTNPKELDLTNQAVIKIAVLGDWGTGVWRDGDLSTDLSPAELVIEGIKGLDPQPDVVIHLGDVYYNGSAGQESENNLNLWSGGSQASFTLNSNHEMYDGAEGYFNVALENKNTNPFKVQQGTSYFSVISSSWVIFGLDSAYYDHSALYSKGALTDDGQKSFISDTLEKNPGKKIIVMTHHNAIAYDASALNTYKRPGTDGDADATGSLAEDIYNALGGKLPDYWYYGHLHNGIVYDEEVIAAKNLFKAIGSGLKSNLRCLGHGGIPFGKASGIYGNPVAPYCANTSIPNPTLRQTNRVLNGFAVITLGESGQINEDVYEVENKPGGGVITNIVWQS